MSRLHKRPDPEPTPIGKALDCYEVRIEGYFSEVVEARNEDHAIEQMKSGLPRDFVEDEAQAWHVSTSRPKPREGRHERG